VRDFNVGNDVNVQGDMIINDQSNNYKLLIHCTNEELIEEEKLRKLNLKEEKTTKFKKFIFGFSVAGIIFFCAALIFWIKGDMNVYSLLLGFSSLFLAIQSIKFNEKPTEFEQRQLDALNEIQMILRERRQR
jgi:hypothetical protein